MKKRAVLKLFLQSLLISATTVGGGYVILSVLRRLYVVRLRLFSEEEMMDIAVLAQSAPGAVTVNAFLLVGWRLAGIPGALAALLGTAIPPILVMSVLAAVYRTFHASPAVAKVLCGMQAGVAAVILDTAIRMTKTALSGKSPLLLLLFAIGLALSAFTSVSSVWLILSAVLLGALYAGIAYAGSRKRGTGS